MLLLFYTYRNTPNENKSSIRSSIIRLYWQVVDQYTVHFAVEKQIEALVRGASYFFYFTLKHFTVHGIGGTLWERKQVGELHKWYWC